MKDEYYKYECLFPWVKVFTIGKAEKCNLSLLVPIKCVCLSTLFRIFKIFYFHPCVQVVFFTHGLWFRFRLITL